MNNLTLSDKQLTFLHHLIGHTAPSDTIMFIRDKTKNNPIISKEIDNLGLDGAFIGYLYNVLDETYYAMPTQKHLTKWKDAVSNGETTLSLDDFIKTLDIIE
jgi:hypothetical protein